MMGVTMLRFTMEAQIVVSITIIWCTLVGLLHLMPKLWARWDTAITNNRLLHIAVGLFALALAVANFLIIFK